jgi:uncharacterized protein (DUF3820 family)
MGNNKILMNFGKYKNQSIDKVFHDKYYYNWIIKQDFFKQKYQELYNALINYKEKPKINFDDLPNDIRQLIFTKRYDIMKQEKQEKINELIKKYPYVYKCSKCNKNQYHLCPNCDYDPNTYTCGDCNVKEHQLKMKKHKQFIKGCKCECGKYKKSGYAMCYTCNKNCLSPIAKAIAYRGYDLGYNPNI